MLLPRLVARMLSVSVLALGSGMVSGQDYPSKPIRIITGSAGGGNDTTSRDIAQGISGSLGQPVIVENRGQAALSAEAVAKAPPDGYTLLVVGASLWTIPLLQKVPYDVVRDYSPLSTISRDVFVVVVHPSLPVKSVKELIALAKARRGELNYATTSPGSVPTLAAELFKAMAGVNIVAVNYKGSAAITTAILSGEVQLTFADVNLQAPHVKTGKLRSLAVTSATPSALVPGLPTVAASGLPAYEAIGMTSILAPAKTPGAIMTRLNQEVVRYLNRPEVKERFLKAGSEIATSSPEELAATIRSDIAKWGKVIKDGGLKVD